MEVFIPDFMVTITYRTQTLNDERGEKRILNLRYRLLSDEEEHTRRYRCQNEVHVLYVIHPQKVFFSS